MCFSQQLFNFEWMHYNIYLLLLTFFIIIKGPPDSNKTVFVRQSSTVVCTAGVAHTMMIEPRDEYNNLCTFGNNDRPTDGYDVKIVQVNNGSMFEQFEKWSNKSFLAYSLILSLHWCEL